VRLDNQVCFSPTGKPAEIMCNPLKSGSGHVGEKLSESRIIDKKPGIDNLSTCFCYYFKAGAFAEVHFLHSVVSYGFFHKFLLSGKK